MRKLERPHDKNTRWVSLVVAPIREDHLLRDYWLFQDSVQRAEIMLWFALVSPHKNTSLGNQICHSYALILYRLFRRMERWDCAWVRHLAVMRSL